MSLRDISDTDSRTVHTNFSYQIFRTGIAVICFLKCQLCNMLVHNSIIFGFAVFNNI